MRSSPQADQKRLAGAIPGARPVVYPETGHCPNWERPERPAIDLQVFLDESRSSGLSWPAGSNCWPSFYAFQSLPLSAGF